MDLLPSDDLVSAYREAAEPVVHIASVWKRYDSPSYLGGALLVRASVFRRVNGYPNDFFGWGGEDDELRDRLMAHGVPIARPSAGSMVDLEGLTCQEKLRSLKKKGNRKCLDKWERRDAHRERRQRNERAVGLTDLRSTVESRSSSSNLQLSHLHVRLDI